MPSSISCLARKRTTMAGKMSPEERRALRAQWARNTREFEAMYERFKVRMRAEDERRERRRRLLRRLLPFRRAA
jgi:hypothetical protein